MAASVESRVPFLDQALVESAVVMPSRFKVRGFRTKLVLREAFRDLLPKSIVARPKMGFPVPLGRWLRTGFRHVLQEFVLSERALRRAWFNPAALTRLVESHLSGTVDQGERLWLLVNFEIWQRVFMDGEDIVAIMRSV